MLVSQRLDTLTFEDKRQVIHLLNIEGRVKDGNIMLTGCIPEAEAVPSPEGQLCGYQPTHHSYEALRVSGLFTVFKRGFSPCGIPF